MIRLRYCDGDEKVIYWGSAKMTFRFSPDGDCPDALAKILLNQTSTGKFEPVLTRPENPYTCLKCGWVGQNEHGLKIHKSKKHKEK
jgi:hypothetical protein